MASARLETVLPRGVVLTDPILLASGCCGYGEEYADIVAYARDRFVTIVPEIDMPSHCNAALASYPQLYCDGKAPALYTGIEVGFSNFCFDKPATFTIYLETKGKLGDLGGDCEANGASYSHSGDKLPKVSLTLVVSSSGKELDLQRGLTATRCCTARSRPAKSWYPGLLPTRTFLCNMRQL